MLAAAGQFTSDWILTAVVFFPLVGALSLLLAPRGDVKHIRLSALLWSSLTFLLTILAFVLYHADVPDYANVTEAGDAYALQQSIAWFDVESTGIDIQYHVGVDAISIWLLLLSSFLTPLAIWASFSSVTERAKEYFCLLLILQTGMSGVFCAMDLLLFYVFYEFTLIPLFFLIGIWGGSQRARAATKFFIFTVAGSVLTFAAVLYVAYYHYAHGGSGKFTLDLPTLVAFGQSGLMPAHVQWWVFLGLAAGFAVKVPLFPVHTWLPLAHTEAPTAGSVILAGVLLKLGSYGFCRLSVPLLPDGTPAFAPLMAVLAIGGIIYGALAAWVQPDVKKLVAYSSVSHMGFCMLGLFSLKMAGVTGSVVYMINHGLATGALFLIVGMIYERYHTREFARLGGLARQMPWLAFFLIVFTFSSIGLPGLNGFIGEFLVLLGTAVSSEANDGFIAGPLGLGYAIFAATGIVLGAVYMLWMCGMLLFGPVKEPSGTPDRSAGLSIDLNAREIAILTPIALVCLWIGVYPKPLINSLQPAIARNILHARAIEQVERGDGFVDVGPVVPVVALAGRADVGVDEPVAVKQGDERTGISALPPTMPVSDTNSSNGAFAVNSAAGDPHGF